MPAINDKAELVSTVKSWLGNSSTTGFTTAIDVAIGLAENDMNFGIIEPSGVTSRGLRTSENEKRISFQVCNKYEMLSDDLIEIRAVFDVDDENNERPIGRIGLDRAGLYDTLRGPPKYYAVNGQQIRIAPRPTEPRNMRIMYYSTVASLLDNPDGTPVLRRYPGLYLYGTLAHMDGWTMDERIVQWKALFVNLLNGANKTHMRRGSPYAAR